MKRLIVILLLIFFLIWIVDADPAPVAAFSANVTSGCSPLAVLFTDATTRTPVNWDWYWYANETKSSDLQNPTNTFTTIGIYNVRLYACSSTHCDWENKTAYITGLGAQAAFSANVTLGLSPLDVGFTDATTCTPNNWDWYWYANETKSSDLKNSTTTFTSKGAYNIRLWSSNTEGGDWENKTGYITVFDEIFSASVYSWVNRTRIESQNESFSTIRSGAGTGVVANWVISSLNASATTNKYNGLGRGIILFNTSGLPDTANITSANFYYQYTGGNANLFSSTRPPIFYITGGTTVSNSSIISNDYSTFNDVIYSSAVTYADAISGKPISFILNANGTSNISLTNTTIFFQRSSWDIFNTSPVGEEVANLFMSFGMATPSYVYLGVIYNISAPTSPVASFSANATSGTNSVPVLFTDTSTNTPTAWNYTFTNVTGNNTQIGFSTTQNPTQVFGSGNFSIALNASNSAGYNWSTQVTFINVSYSAAVAPVASFTKSATVLRIPKVLTVTDASTNTPTSWAWSWGDGTANSTTQNPTHLYTKRGIFTINLAAANAGGTGIATAQTVRVVGYENLW